MNLKHLPLLPDQQQGIGQLAQKALAIRDPFTLIEDGHLKIKTKAATLENFILNRAQRRFLERIKVLWVENKIIRVNVLKARQLGISTLIEGVIFALTSYTDNTNSLIIADDLDGSNYIFEMSKLYQEQMPEHLLVKEKRSNQKKLEFADIHSQILIDTSQNPDAGRKYTFRNVHLCLSGDTQIITKDGYVQRLVDIKPGDEIKTHLGNRAIVKGLSCIKSIDHFQTDDVVKIYTSGNRANPIICTPDHLIFVRNNEQGKKVNGQWRKAKDISRNDYLGFPYIAINDGQVVKETLPSTPIGRRNKWNFSGKEVCLDFDLGYFVGLYLAEGTVNINRILIAAHEKEESRLHIIAKIISPYTTSYHIRRHKNSKTIVGEYYGVAFAQFIKILCGEKKEIPDRFWSFPRSFLKGLIKGYIEGDGHFVKDNEMITVTSIRVNLLTQMRDLLVSFRYGYASLDFKHGGYNYGRNCKDCWVLRIHGKTAYKLKKDLGWELINRTRKPSADWKPGIKHFWVPVVDISYDKCEYVYDIVLDHKDHSFRTITGCGVHNSEYAFFDNANALMDGLSNSVPALPRTMIIKETTANGLNHFKEEWDAAEKGDSDYVNIFIPWYWGDDYRMKTENFILGDPSFGEITSEERYLYDVMQKDGIDFIEERLQWRRWCIRNNCRGYVSIFKQEYPSNPQEAFVSAEKNILITPIMIDALRGLTISFPRLKKIVSIDPSLGGDECVMYYIENGEKKAEKVLNERDTMKIVGEVLIFMAQNKCDDVVVDCIGIGKGIADRLNEIPNKRVNYFNSSNSASKENDFVNLRSEAYFYVMEQIRDKKIAEIKDIELSRQLTTVPFKIVNSNGKLLLMPKDWIKKKLGRSPDRADCFIMGLWALQYVDFWTPQRSKGNKDAYDVFEDTATHRNPMTA